MDTTQEYVARAENCSNRAADVNPNEEDEARVEAFWQREAQIQATLAVAAALHELRNMLARDPSQADSEASIRVAGHVFTHDGDAAQ